MRHLVLCAVLVTACIPDGSLRYGLAYTPSMGWIEQNADRQFVVAFNHTNATQYQVTVINLAGAHAPIVRIVSELECTLEIPNSTFTRFCAGTLEGAAAGIVAGDEYEVEIGVPGTGSAFVPSLVIRATAIADVQELELPSPAPVSVGFTMHAHSGLALAAGDVNGNGFDDLVIGSPGQPAASTNPCPGGSVSAGVGGIVRLFETADPGTPSAIATWSHTFANQPGHGSAIVVVDLIGQTDAEVVFGSPFAAASAGSLYVLVDGQPPPLVESGGVASEFATSLTSMPYNGSQPGRGSVAVGAPGTNGSDGVVHRLEMSDPTTISLAWTGAGEAGAAGRLGQSVGVGLVDADAVADIVATSPQSPVRVTIFESANNFAGTPGPAGAAGTLGAASLDETGTVQALVYGDPRFDTAMTDSGRVVVRPNTAAEVSLEPDTPLDGGGYGTFLATDGDTNRDGIADIAVGSLLGTVTLWESQGPDLVRAFQSERQTDDDLSRTVAFGDFNADGFDDLVVGLPCWDTSNEDEGGYGIRYSPPVRTLPIYGIQPIQTSPDAVVNLLSHLEFDFRGPGYACKVQWGNGATTEDPLCGDAMFEFAYPISGTYEIEIEMVHRSVAAATAGAVQLRSTATIRACVGAESYDECRAP